MNSPPRSFARDFVEGRVDLPRPENPALVSDQQPVVVEGPSDVVARASDVVAEQFPAFAGASLPLLAEPAPLEAENVVVGEQHALAGARKRIELAGSRRRVTLRGSSTVRQVV